MRKEKYFLDTSFLLDLMKEKKEAVKIHRKIKGDEFTGTPCLYELSKFAQFDVYEFLKNNEVLKFGPKDAKIAGKIYQKLAKKGQLIGEIDIIIAGMVSNRKFTLVTRDKDFEKIEKIKIKNY